MQKTSKHAFNAAHLYTQQQKASNKVVKKKNVSELVDALSRISEWKKNVLEFLEAEQLSGWLLG